MKQSWYLSSKFKTGVPGVNTKVISMVVPNTGDGVMFVRWYVLMNGIPLFLPGSSILMELRARAGILFPRSQGVVLTGVNATEDHYLLVTQPGFFPIWMDVGLCLGKAETIEFWVNQNYLFPLIDGEIVFHLETKEPLGETC